MIAARRLAPSSQGGQLSPSIPFRCAQCGVEVSAEHVPEGLCPRCLLQLALGGESDPASGLSQRYRLMSLLGEGKTGTTYLAERVRTVPDLVAIRILKMELSSHLSVTRLESWRRTLHALAHPNVAPVLDAGVIDGGQPYVVREFVQGLSLATYCRRSRLSTRDRLWLLIRVCDTIAYTHAQRVVHGGIKSSNVLVFEHNEAPVPKVVDFAVASLTREPRSRLGNDVSDDVCALGDLLDALISGAETLVAGHVDQRLASVVKRTRESDPGRRYKSVSHLAADLRSLSQALL